MSTLDDPKYQAGEAPTSEQVAAEVIVSPDTRRENRIPPGQSRTRKWPVLHAGTVPEVDRETWSLEVVGLVERPLQLTWDEFRALPRIKVFADFHCVTQWSRLGNLWEGVSARHLMELAGVRPEARYVIPGGYDDGWTTNLPLEDLLADDVLLADTHDGEPLDAHHGGPVRLMVPRLYAWKSAKWLKSLELVAEDRPGYWERGGYHMYGDPWTEQRFG
jgi:DMSO/TMAO reductase YedYZ molybdopterin-dependent catalytic subunit